MTDIEIPLEKDRHGHYRFFEILPGLLSWTLLLMPIILSYINVTAAVIFILFYLLVYFVRSLGFSISSLRGYMVMRSHLKLDWEALVQDVENRKLGKGDGVHRPQWHKDDIERLETSSNQNKPSELIHAVIIATVNESRRFSG